MKSKSGRADTMMNSDVGRPAGCLKGGADAILVQPGGGRIPYGHKTIRIITSGHRNGDARLATTQLPDSPPRGNLSHKISHGIQAQVIPQQADAGYSPFGDYSATNYFFRMAKIDVRLLAIAWKLVQFVLDHCFSLWWAVIEAR